jgi:hypothetical protein
MIATIRAFAIVEVGMAYPAGTVAALSSAAATVFSIGLAFLGYWGIHQGGAWHFADVLVVILAMAGFICFGLVPWFATSPVDHPDDDSLIRQARHAFLVGVGALWLAIVVSIFT